MIARAPILRMRAAVRACMLLLPMLLLAGCAIQRISEQSQQALAAGEYEKAIQALDQGLKEYPDSTALHSAMIQARTQAVSKMTSNAAALRVISTRIQSRSRTFEEGRHAQISL